MDKFYITTSIAYVNAPPHVGHALELLQADVLARYHRQVGDDVYFLTGTDEHGATVVKGAEKHGKNVEDFVEEIAGRFKELTKVLNISNNDFIRTTDKQRHWPAVEKVWRALEVKGDLYKSKYRGLYCVGHEAFLKPSELENGKCPLHKQEPEKVEEENWFFKLKKYKKEVKKLIEKGELKIVPAHRIPEILNLINDAEDVSFSRPREKLSWGIPVPGDETQTIYVWADALVNYISAIGYADNSETFRKLWPADAHLVGKDIFRFHALIWPAMLLSIGLPLPKAVYIHGFITVDGEKMSKTVGNIVDPFDLVKKYGLEPVRYFLLREIPSGEDGDFSYKKLEDRYNGDLANNLGNLVSRVAKLIETKLESELNFEARFLDREAEKQIEETRTAYERAINEFKLHEALAKLWELFNFANAFIDEKKPWADVGEHPEHFLETITTIIAVIINTAQLLEPFMPETADKVFGTFSFDKKTRELNGYKFTVTKAEPLFPRLK